MFRTSTGMLTQSQAKRKMTKIHQIRKGGSFGAAVAPQAICPEAVKMNVQNNPVRELTGEERTAIRKLVTCMCANYDREYGCLPLDCNCYMLGKYWTGSYCKYFKNAVLPLNVELEIALLGVGFVPGRKACLICGRLFPTKKKKAYCSVECSKTARRKQQREYMQKSRGNC